MYDIQIFHACSSNQAITRAAVFVLGAVNVNSTKIRHEPVNKYFGKYVSVLRINVMS